MIEKNILLVDDDIDQLSILAAMVGHLPYNIMTALSGTRALEMLKESAPILVITDMVMPDINGAQIARAVRVDGNLKDTKVVLVTSLIKYISDEDRTFVHKVMTKPIKKAEIDAVLRELLPNAFNSEPVKTVEPTKIVEPTQPLEVIQTIPSVATANVVAVAPVSSVADTLPNKPEKLKEAQATESNDGEA